MTSTRTPPSQRSITHGGGSGSDAATPALGRGSAGWTAARLYVDARRDLGNTVASRPTARQAIRVARCVPAARAAAELATGLLAGWFAQVDRACPAPDCHGRQRSVRSDRAARRTETFYPCHYRGRIGYLAASRSIPAVFFQCRIARAGSSVITSITRNGPRGIARRKTGPAQPGSRCRPRMTRRSHSRISRAWWRRCRRQRGPARAVVKTRRQACARDPNGAGCPSPCGSISTPAAMRCA